MTKAERTITIDGCEMPAPTLAPGLHVVATPIGNLADITLRALTTLAAADAIAAEDTRHTGRLLQHYGIATPLVRYDEHGAAGQRPKLLGRLAAGEAIALVSDAGTPLISDPGYRLVAEARDAGLDVHAVPGPAAPIAALSVAGLATDMFTFAGFLPAKAAARDARIAELRGLPGTLVLFEAPHRLSASLHVLAARFGERQAAVARELTKRFETVERGTLNELAAIFDATAAKGEIVILIAPGTHVAASDEEVEGMLRDALEHLPPSAAAADVARATGRDRRTLYKQALSLRARE